MAQRVNALTERRSGRLRTRRVQLLFWSCGLIVVLAITAACAGLSDSGTQEEALQTREARRNVPPPTTGSPDVPGSPGTDTANLAATGQQLYATLGCQGCHSLDGAAGVGPTWQGLYGREVKLTDGSTVTADEAYISESVLNPQAKVVDGFQPVMPSYQGQVDDEKIRAIIAFMQTLE